MLADRNGLVAMDESSQFVGLVTWVSPARLLDLLDQGQQFVAEFRQAIAGGMPDHDVASDTLLQLGKASMDGRLAQMECLRRGDGAAMASDRQKSAEDRSSQT